MSSDRNYGNGSRKRRSIDARHWRWKRRHRAARNPERRNATAAQRVKADDSAGSIRRLSIARATVVALIVSAILRLIVLVFVLVIAAASRLAMTVRRAATAGMAGVRAVRGER
jgi:hypothetical protein